jgi:hypothetical protein
MTRPTRIRCVGAACRALIVVLATVPLAGCRADAEVVEILPTEQPDEFDVIVDTCNADLDVAVDESTSDVVVTVRNNDRRLIDTGGDDCQDAVRIELDAPLGDRTFRLEDGRDIAVTTFPVDTGG